MPAPENAAVNEHLQSLLSSAVYSQQAYYRMLGMRDRILTLPLMVAAVITLMWRQVPSVGELTRMLNRDDVLWAKAVRVSRQAVSERFLSFPYGLFEQVFRQNPDAYSDYKQACRSGLTTLRIEIEGNSPDFQALHWESLKDPQQPKPFAVEGVFTRKRVQRSLLDVDLKPSPVINLLVVTARPDEESDVGYRTISRPLIEAIQQRAC